MSHLHRQSHQDSDSVGRGASYKAGYTIIVSPGKDSVLKEYCVTKNIKFLTPTYLCFFN